MPALDGLKVIDLTRVLAGPFCTMLLGDMGADVIKIEEPEFGDDTRGWAPFVDGESSYFLGVNRNKRSVALDLKSAEGVEVLTRLVGDADVLVENLRPGTLERIGFGYERLATLNPRLIYASVTGYGHTGPRRDEAGYDPVMQAEAGVMDITGPADGQPSRVGVAVTDFLAGQFMFSGILLALRERDRTGRGQAVDISLFDAILAAMTLPAGIAFATGRSPVRMGNRHPSIAPYETFRARRRAGHGVRRQSASCGASSARRSSGRICPMTRGSRTTPDGCAIAMRWSRSSRAAARRMDRRRVRAPGSTRHGVPCGRVRSIDQALLTRRWKPGTCSSRWRTRSLGNIQTIGNPMALSASPPSYRRPPPALGEHTARGACASSATASTSSPASTRAPVPDSGRMASA